MRPILFLDFDDVICLNNKGFGGYDALEALGKVQKGEAKVADFQNIWDVLFDKACVKNLRLINDEFQPIYVISSSWTRFMNEDAVRAVLFHGGLPFVCENIHVDWETVKIASTLRSTEVGHWLDRHQEYKDHWVAIDDIQSGTGWIDWDTGESNNEFVVLCDVDIGLKQFEYTRLRTALQTRNRSFDASFVVGV